MAERIPVAAPRVVRRPAPEPLQRDDPSGAGLVLIALIALAAVAGWWVGTWFGMGVPGAILGGVFGLPAAFAGVYVRYGRR